MPRSIDKPLIYRAWYAPARCFIWSYVPVSGWGWCGTRDRSLNMKAARWCTTQNIKEGHHGKN